MHDNIGNEYFLRKSMEPFSPLLKKVPEKLLNQKMKKLSSG